MVEKRDRRYNCSAPKKVFADHPYFTQTGKDREGDGNQYMANMRDGAVAGFKYFLFDSSETRISVQTRGGGMGRFKITDGKSVLANVPVNGNASLKAEAGIRPLHFTYVGDGAVNFIAFTIE